MFRLIKILIRNEFKKPPLRTLEIPESVYFRSCRDLSDTLKSLLIEIYCQDIVYILKRGLSSIYALN